MDEAFLTQLPTDYAQAVRRRIAELERFGKAGFLPAEYFQGRKVLDWEAGNAGFSAAFLFLGARDVVAIDSWSTAEAIPAEIHGLGRFAFIQTPITNWLQNDGSSHLGSFDVIFSNTVTEHIADLPPSFDAIRALLKPGGFYFNNHDNYYSPCGSHDHGFWFYGANGAVEFQGVACWGETNKCAASAAHRLRLQERWPWTWSKKDDAALTPEDCTQCRYFKRSQPWAHLTRVDEFVSVYPDRSFLTARPFSSLNKVTAFQLRQLLSEAGFDILKFHRVKVTNKPSPELIAQGFSELDLQTSTIWTLCQARASGGAGLSTARSAA